MYVLYKNSNVAWQGNTPNQALFDKLGYTMPRNAFQFSTPEELDQFKLYRLVEAPKKAGKIITVTNHLKEGYTVKETYTEVDDPDYVAPDPVAEAKKSKAGELAAARYDEEVGGFDLGGVAVATDRDSQAKLMAVRIKAKEDAAYTVNWKTETGFVTLDAAAIIATADAVMAFVQALFDKEQAKIVEVNAATTVEDVQAIFWTEPEVE